VPTLTQALGGLIREDVLTAGTPPRRPHADLSLASPVAAVA